MQFDLADFCLDLTRLSLGILRDKYRGKIPRDLTTAETCKCMMQYDLSKRVIRTWYEDRINLDGLYLIQADNKFEVFLGERGGKMLLKIYDSLECAIIRWLDLMFNELAHAAPDCKL